jgi:hypothetical protein
VGSLPTGDYVVDPWLTALPDQADLVLRTLAAAFGWIDTCLAATTTSFVFSGQWDERSSVPSAQQGRVGKCSTTSVDQPLSDAIVVRTYDNDPSSACCSTARG